MASDRTLVFMVTPLFGKTFGVQVICIPVEGLFCLMDEKKWRSGCGPCNGEMVPAFEAMMKCGKCAEDKCAEDCPALDHRKSVLELLAGTGLIKGDES